MKHSFIVSFICIMLMAYVCGCGSSIPSPSPGNTTEKEIPPDAEPRDATPVCLIPEAPGTVKHTSDTVSLDISNSSHGYLMLTYSGSNEKSRLQIIAPNGVEYTYAISSADTCHTYPLAGGNGAYTARVLEAVSASDNKYALIFTQDFDVTISDEFLPFLYPNCYVSFVPESMCVQKAYELAQSCYSDLDVIGNIYNYVIKNITYDKEKAANIAYAYIPDPDRTLESMSGICFDYASLMSAMLRSQSIPTRLEVGYSGETYHAWISCYADEIGWIDNIIEFNGKTWSLMDPTLAANNDSSAVKKYVGDGSNYLVKYTY